MSARIAQDAIATALNAAGDYRSKLSVGEVRIEPQKMTADSSPQGHGSAKEDNPTYLPPLPEQPQPPGAAFAVALISGQLPPRPTSERELQLRLGSADLPKQGAMMVHDRLA